MLGLLEMLQGKLRETLISLGPSVITKYVKSLKCGKGVRNLDSLYYASLEITPEANLIQRTPVVTVEAGTWSSVLPDDFSLLQ